MIRKSALPDIGVAADERSEFVRIGAFNKLRTAFKGYVVSWSE